MTYQRTMLGLDDADRIVDAIIALNREKNGVPLSIAVVDSHGDLIKYVSMDGASWNSKCMAHAKAYTAAKLRRDTAKLSGWMAENGFQLIDWADPNLTSVGGGVCIYDKGVSSKVVLGAVAVSGWPDPAVDDAYARAGADAVDI